jgi:hypothetical protein
MLRRTTARVLVLLSLMAGTVVVSGSPAMAFTKRYNCFDSGVGAGQSTRFYADNGTFLGQVTWSWRWEGQGGQAYHVDIYDAVSDGASFSVRVDKSYAISELTSDDVLNYYVRKYRVVWNGYATNWLSPITCTAP